MSEGTFCCVVVQYANNKGSNQLADACSVISTIVVPCLDSTIYIRITCPCNEHPLTPHFYIEKVGFTRVYIFFLFLLHNIDCGYSLEPPR